MASSPDQDLRRRVGALQADLLAWYERHGRDLPWRHTRDPYSILVSEVMLQQTQVKRVRPKYAEFIAAFPSFEALANAPLAEVIRRWAPLGYNRRAVRLHAIARAVVDNHGTHLPDTVEELTELDGLGRYTAAAVACFAHERQVAVVDTNVRRVLLRVFADVLEAEAMTAHSLDSLATTLLPVGEAYAWNQALMDLGATVCTARAPRCLVCPVAAGCDSRGWVKPVEAPRQRAAESRIAYRVKARFEETSRYFRGRVVDVLRELPNGRSIEMEALGPRVRPDFDVTRLPWLRDLIDGLERDGLLVVSADAPTRIALP